MVEVEPFWRARLGAGRGRRDGGGGGEWHSDIPVIAYCVNISNAAAPDHEGLLQPLLRRWQRGGCGQEVFAMPAVHAVIDWKWERYCKRLLLVELGFYLLWLVSFAAFTVLFQDEDTSLSLRELAATRRGRAALAMHATTLVGMAPFVAMEACSVAAYGVWDWASAWNLLDTATYVDGVAIIALHVARWDVGSGWLSIAAATQILLLLFRLQYFSRVFKPTRFAFVDDVKAVLADTKFYLLFLMLVVLGWGTAYHILFRLDQEQHDEFATFPRALLTMVAWLGSDMDLAGLLHSHNPVAAALFAVAFIFVVTVVLMNLLIGLLTASLQKVTESEGVRMLASKAQVIDEIDTLLPRCGPGGAWCWRCGGGGWRSVADGALLCAPHAGMGPDVPLIHVRHKTPACSHSRSDALSRAAPCPTHTNTPHPGPERLPDCRWLEARMPSLYPRYVHVLRVDPGRLDRVQEGARWGEEQEGSGDATAVSEVDEESTTGPGTRGGAGAGSEGALVARLQRMERDLEEIKALLSRMQPASGTATA